MSYVLTKTQKKLVNKKNLGPFIMITSLFFLWGLANNMTDTLLAAFKRIMSMSDFQTSWIQLAFYGSYFLLAIPAALIIKKYTYKSGVLLGLGMFILGSLLFYPASITMAYGHFLTALFVLAGGLSILETACNPYIMSMGTPETATRRLNMAQAFNPIGSITGVFLSKVFILSNLNHLSANERASLTPTELTDIQSQELTAVMGPYVGVAMFLIVLWMAIKITAMPEGKDKSHQINFTSSLSRLMKKPHYYWSVIAQFMYVGAQIGVWSFTIRLVMSEIKINEDLASNYYLAALILFSFFRFVFTYIMKYVDASLLLLIAALGAMSCTLAVILMEGSIAVLSLVGISAFMSLMFPTIYGIGLKDLGNDTKIGAAGLIMAILGGAVITSIQGQISDMTGDIKLSFAVPFICFIVVAVFSIFNISKNKSLNYE